MILKSHKLIFRSQLKTESTWTLILQIPGVSSCCMWFNIAKPFQKICIWIYQILVFMVPFQMCKLPFSNAPTTSWQMILRRFQNKFYSLVCLTQNKTIHHFKSKNDLIWVHLDFLRPWPDWIFEDKKHWSSINNKMNSIKIKLQFKGPDVVHVGLLSQLIRTGLPFTDHYCLLAIRCFIYWWRVIGSCHPLVDANRNNI